MPNGVSALNMMDEGGKKEKYEIMKSWIFFLHSNLLIRFVLHKFQKAPLTAEKICVHYS